VPDDRLLLETDRDTPAGVDAGMLAMALAVSAAKGAVEYPLERVVAMARSNAEECFGFS
jgi:hypothetical protein